MPDETHADVTKVVKRGDGYLVEGVSKGRKASFWVTAQSVESMGHKEARAFFKRAIAGQARRKRGDE